MGADLKKKFFFEFGGRLKKKSIFSVIISLEKRALKIKIRQNQKSAPIFLSGI